MLSVEYSLHLKYTLFVHTSTLLHYVERYLKGEIIPELVVHWDMWGQNGTRFIKRDVLTVWLRSVHPSFFGLTEVLTLRRCVHSQRVIQKRDSPSLSCTSLDLLQLPKHIGVLVDCLTRPVAVEREPCTCGQTVQDIVRFGCFLNINFFLD